MSVAIESNHYEQAFAAAGLDQGPAWLTALRQTGLAAFAAVGFPTTQHEDWRYTSLGNIPKTPFRPAETASVDASVLEPVLFDDDRVDRLVFVNGHYDQKLSRIDQLPAGVVVQSLADAIAADLPLLAAHLGQHARLDGHPFAALATAFVRDGVVVHVPKGVALERPVHVIHVSRPGAEPALVCPRLLLVAEESSQAMLVETFLGTDRGPHLVAPVAEIVAGENAFVDHYRVQHESLETGFFGLLRIQQARSSNVQSHLLNFGGAVVRNEIAAHLAGEGGNCDLYGLFMPTGTQHMDNHLRVEHEAPHCDSREFFKGILDEKGTGVFTGRIYVHKPAQKTDAKQSNMNLLLSPDAQIDTKPQLEIFADDVKCTHGATIGQMDEDALFYLRARGVDARSARSLLVYAFASETVEQVSHPALRTLLHEAIITRLPHGVDLKELV